MKTTVRKLADCIGVTTETIRHYREIGLLHPEIQENGYYDYTVGDALTTLLTRELRSYELPLESICELYAKSDVADYNKLLEEREATLLKDLEMIHLELSRMRETRVYASCGMRIMNQVEEFDGPPTWAVSMLNSNRGFHPCGAMERWVEHLPFTYVSATIPLDELNKKSGAEPYDVQVGCGALIHYVEKFQLPLDEFSFYQPGGHFIRTCVATRDILSLSPNDLSPLLEYAKAHSYVFASCTGGRLLFIENAETDPLYYILIWVRVDPA